MNVFDLKFNDHETKSYTINCSMHVIFHLMKRKFKIKTSSFEHKMDNLLIICKGRHLALTNKPSIKNNHHK